jgi:Transmembrane amino acid transporter protein
MKTPTFLLVAVVVILLLDPVSSSRSTTCSHVQGCRARSRVALVVVRGGAAAPTKTALPKAHISTASAVTKTTVKNRISTGGGTATIPSLIGNLVKAIVGVGVLSLPAGIAAFGNAPSSLVPALALITIIGILSGYGFSLIGRVCTYREDVLE